MYNRVEAQIVLSGMSKKEIAQQLGISYNTLNLKLSGKSSFSLDEATRLKCILHAEDTVETLFEKECYMAS